MNGDEYKFGEKIGKMESDIRALHDKADVISDQISAFTQGIGKTVQEHTIQISTLVEKTSNNEKHTNWVSKKVDKWVTMGIAACVGIAGWIFKIAHLGK